MRFFNRAGFELSQDPVLDCATHGGRLTAHGGDKVLAPAHLTGFSASEVDYSAAAGNDFEALAGNRLDVRSLQADDMNDIVRIDQRVTGRRREAYIRELVEEAMTDSAVRVSLVARVDGIAAGFVMARTDFGDFGRAEPVAVLDTIGVDPDYAHRGVGHALLSQLFVNLEGLRVERVETVVARENFGLLGFFYDVGFEHSQLLSFVKRVA
jgi:ribosomal protein S18 acetylase RimI-like enzyme